MDRISLRRMVEIVCGGYTGEHDIMSSKESLQNHLKVLETRHRELDKKIESDYEHHMDDTVLANEKVEKLNLKREIEELKNKIEGHPRP